MKEGPDIARTAALIGDPARANILTALMSGKALTATELAHEAGITAQTCSWHLSKLETGGLLNRRRQGRHNFFSLASDEVAQVLEGLMGLAAGAGELRTRTGPKDAALRKARVCYNHLAGEMGIRLFDSLVERDFITHRTGALALTPAGAEFVREFGIDLDRLEAGKPVLCRECLDWSERKSHLAGSLGRALLSRIETLGWAQRDPATRVVAFTRHGETRFTDFLLV